MSLAGKVALIAGSTQGIGLQISKRLCRDGAQVYIGSRKRENVNSALEEFRQENLDNVAGSTCHVMHSEDRKNFVKNAVRKFGKIDILVNNVACNPAPNVNVLNTEEGAYDKIMDTNVKSMFFMIKETVPYMNPSGSIICMSSLVGHRPDLLPSVYAISKSAINTCIKVVAPELAQSGIRINGISPGIFKTTFGNWAIEHDRTREGYLEGTAIKRFGEPGEIGGLVAYLCSDDAAYVTGECFVIAGGTFSRL